MARRRQSDSGESFEKVAISLKLPKKLLDRIDSYWKENSSSFTGRTHFIEEACSFYLTCEKCSKCGMLNTPQSKTCSNCGNKLESGEYLELKNRILHEITQYDNVITSILSYKEEYIDLNNKIEWYINKLDDKRKSVVDSLLPDFYATINSSMRSVDCFLDCRDYYKELYEDRHVVPSREIWVSRTAPHVFNDCSSKSDINPTSSDEEIYYRCAEVNYSYYRAKLIIDYCLETVSTQDLKLCLLSLINSSLYLPSLHENVVNGLNILRGIEKMIDILPEIQESGSISITRREQQD